MKLSGTGCYPREYFRGDVLYAHYRHRDVAILFSKQTGSAMGVTDYFCRFLAQQELISRESCRALEAAAVQALAQPRPDASVTEIYSRIHDLRRQLLGCEVLEKARDLAANRGIQLPWLLDQRQKKQELLTQPVCFLLYDPTLFSAMREDIAAARAKGYFLAVSPEEGQLLPTRQWYLSHMDCTGASFCSPEDVPAGPVFVYGEDGLFLCRNLPQEAFLQCVPRGYYAQAVTGTFGSKGLCALYVPAGLDITKWVPLKTRTRLSYRQLVWLWQDLGNRIYSLSVPELYRKYPQYFLNIYSDAPRCPEELPLPKLGDTADFSEFDRAVDAATEEFLNSFPGVTYFNRYFDKALQPAPICRDSSCPQEGILVQGLRINRSQGARVIPCNGISPRQALSHLTDTALVSNFLFFLTPKLGTLYNELRQDRPREQADVASGHLDYMLTYRDGKRIETFPLFGKTCIAMREDGSFLFCNFFLGGGSLEISGLHYRWEKSDVNAETSIRVYTPYYSSPDKDADRNTYVKTVGAGRVNAVILREKVTCIRRGDVVLPSVGVVLSLTEEAAKPLLEKCRPLEDGYYDVKDLELTLQLDPPEGVEGWEHVRWAYGGGLTLIRNGIGLCDGDHMDAWFEAEGWTSPLSRQTQESNLHSLVKHPRTAIGVTKNGDLAVLVFSGRTWRSTGADYREMIEIARQLIPDIHMLMNGDGGGSAMLGLLTKGSLRELSYPSTSAGSCAGQIRPVNTVFYIPID